MLEAPVGAFSDAQFIDMSEKTSRKHFLFASGTTIVGWLAFCGFRRENPVGREAPAAATALPVEAKPEPRAVARPRP